MNFNKAFVLGNLTRDPEKRSLPSGQPVVSFGVATNRFYKDKNGQRQQDVEFHNIVIFGKMAETAALYLKKGSLVLIEGRLKTREWQDQSGIKHYKTEIIADNMQLGPRMGGGNMGLEQRPVNEYQRSQKPVPNASQKVKDDDIPVIEEEATFQGFDDGGNEEIDVKNIPF